MSHRSFYLSPTNDLRADLTPGELRDVYRSRRGLLWVDVGDMSEEDGEFIFKTFGFHPLAVEDCVSPRIHPPKVEDFGDYLFIVVHGINYSSLSDIVETQEVEVFLGRNFVVSCHNFPVAAIQTLLDRVEANTSPMRRGADFLAHAIFDGLIDDVLPTIDRMGEVANVIEDLTVQHPQPSLLATLLKLKRSTMHIQRVMAPQREVMNSISRGDYALIRPEALAYYRDVYDHIFRVAELNQSLREQAVDILSTYMSSVNNRLNESMRLLALVTVVFMPLSLLTGIYGMNFDHMPELHWRWAYFAVLGIIAVSIAGAFVWLVFGRWLSKRRQQYIPRGRPFAVDLDKLAAELDDAAQDGRA